MYKYEKQNSGKTDEELANLNKKEKTDSENFLNSKNSKKNELNFFHGFNKNKKPKFPENENKITIKNEENNAFLLNNDDYKIFNYNTIKSVDSGNLFLSDNDEAKNLEVKLNSQNAEIKNSNNSNKVFKEQLEKYQNTPNNINLVEAIFFDKVNLTEPKKNDFTKETL